MKSGTFFVYIMSNGARFVLYVGVTNNLVVRNQQHKAGLGSSFTKRYNVDQLVYYETFDSITAAIEREKRIKGGSRARKVQLISDFNPEWKDLSDAL